MGVVLDSSLINECHSDTFCSRVKLELGVEGNQLKVKMLRLSNKRLYLNKNLLNLNTY